MFSKDLPSEIIDINEKEKRFIEDQKGLSLTEKSRLAAIQIEKKLITEALEITKGHKGKAARYLGISEKTLYNKMKEYALLKVKPTHTLL